MFGTRIKIDKALHARLEQAAEIAGYSSTDEFINHVLTREADVLIKAKTDGEVEEQLRGLGYIE